MNVFHSPYQTAGPSRARRRVPGCNVLSAFVALTFLLIVPAAAQVSLVRSVSPTSATEGSSVTLRLELFRVDVIQRVFLVFRPFGSGQYNRMEMNILGTSATALLPSSTITPPFLEYYIVVADRFGTLSSYPESGSSNPFEDPPSRRLQLAVSPQPSASDEIVFLSPEPNAHVSPDDVVFSVSLLRADSSVVKRSTEIFLDRTNVTRGAVFSGDIIVIVPENIGLTIAPGPHQLTVRLFNRRGVLHRSASLSFTVLGEQRIPEAQGRPWTTAASVQLESRHEDIASTPTWYNRGRIDLTGSMDEWRFTGSAFLTSDEKPSLQPQHRYFVSAEIPWFRVAYGDAYPAFSPLILSGRRVRGLSSALRLDWFNLDVALGQTNRPVDGTVLQLIGADTLGREQLRDPNAAYGQINQTLWGKFSYGTYARKLFAVRPSFSAGDGFALGFTYLKSKDNISSIRYGRNPEENLVIGADLLLRFDERRIEVSGQGAFSAHNSDISSGSFTNAYIDSVFPNHAGAIKWARDILGKFITVNDNLKPLKLDFLSTLAYDVSLGLNYFDNVVKIAYTFRGSDYTSFGQPFLRKDIRGFTLADRFRFAENEMQASLGAEFLRDNTGRYKVSTTVFTNLSAALSYVPEEALPSATIGYAWGVADNGLSVTGPDSAGAIAEVTNRFTLQSAYEFQFEAKHSASLAFSVSSRNDKSVRQQDVTGLAVSAGLTTRYAIPLQTSLDVILNWNTLPSFHTVRATQRFDYTVLSLGGRFELVPEILFLRALIAPSLGDLRRTVWDAGAGWNITPQMLLEMQFSFFAFPGLPSDGIWSVRYKVDI